MGDPQKWLVYSGKSHLEMDDLGVPSGKLLHTYRKSPFLVGKSMNSMGHVQ